MLKSQNNTSMLNMKTPLIILLLLATIKTSMAQLSAEKVYFEKSVIDTFKDESIVVLRKFEEISYSNIKENDYKISKYIRIQYVLKDRNAVESFKAATKKVDYQYFKITQIKPSGKINIIYEFEDKFYPKNGMDKDDDDNADNPKNEKIPLENIEIGDIIEYQYLFAYNTILSPDKQLRIRNGNYYTQINQANYNTYKALTKRSNIFNDDYAMASFLIRYVLPKDLDMVSKTVNTKAVFNKQTESQNLVYELNIENLPSRKAEEMSFSYNYYPWFSLGIVQTNTAKKAMYPFQFENYPVTPKDINALAQKMFLDKNYISKYNYYLNTQKGGPPYKQQTTTKFFKTFNNTFVVDNKNKFEAINLFHDYIINSDKLNYHQFDVFSDVILLARYCQFLKVPFKIIACQPRFNGSWEDVVTPLDFYWGIYIPNEKKDLFITDFGTGSNIYELKDYLVNTKVLLIDINPSIAVKTIDYPDIKPNSNTLVETLKVSLLNDSALNYAFHINSNYSKFLKYNINDRISNYVYIEELRSQNPFYGYLPYHIFDFNSFKDTTDLLPEIRRVNQNFSHLKDKKQSESVLSHLTREYPLNDITLDSFRLKNNGIFADNYDSSINYNVYFKSKQLIKPTSFPNQFVLNLGSLITTQYDVSDYKMNERLTDVDNRYLRTIIWNIEVELPKGYKPLNINTFKINFKNKAGVFTSHLEEKNNKLIMVVTKEYISYHLPKTEWSEMVDYLYQAMNFVNLDLLLEKK